VATGEFILGHTNEYGFFPPSPVVPADGDPDRILPASANPHHHDAGYRDLGVNGTFVAYRKLWQNVAGFWQFLERESKRLRSSSDPAFMVWLASKMMGRWPNGAPLTLSPDRADAGFAGRDDFLYAQDPAGLACPLGSHIRRTNPRDHLRPAAPTESLHMTARHQLLRRGRPYGPPLFDLSILDRTDAADLMRGVLDLKDDGRDRGLHFLAVNASLRSQFEFVQQSWANNPRFNGLVGNPDPVIGDNDPAAAAPGLMDIPGCPAGMRTSSLPRFVSVRGGAYLFMPSVSALRYLAVPL
jgi:deferrochelatase/peroxidase EfeB